MARSRQPMDEQYSPSEKADYLAAVDLGRRSVDVPSMNVAHRRKNHLVLESKVVA